MRASGSDSIRKSNVTYLRTAAGSARRICPCYRLAQLIQIDSPEARNPSLPICAALDPAINIDRDMAAKLCRSGEFPACDRFRTAYPNWSPDDRRFPYQSTTEQHTATTSSEFKQHVLSSIAWVIGIPTAITIAIMLAIWITENVWIPTESIVLHLFA
jgi:hypothetical protein